MSPTKAQSFTEAFSIKNRSYEFKLNLEPLNSILSIDITDKT